MTRGISWLDRRLAALGEDGTLFRDGWGAFDLAALRAQAARRSAPIAPRIDWQPGTRRGAITRQRGHFASPCPGLPAGVRRAEVTALFPDDLRALCVFLGGHGEETVKIRQVLARPLLRKGVGALLLQTPFYGTRRPHGQQGRQLATVAHQLMLARAVVEEASALVAWIRARCLPAGLYGYSMGGALAGHAVGRLPWPTPAALGATGISGGSIFARDLIARQVAWGALGAGGRDRLQAAYDAVGLAAVPRPLAVEQITLVGCRRDGMVAPASVEALAALWPAARLRWINAGHVSGLLRSAPIMRRALLRGLFSSRRPGVSDPRPG